MKQSSDFFWLKHVLKTFFFALDYDVFIFFKVMVAFFPVGFFFVLFLSYKQYGTDMYQL